MQRMQRMQEANRTLLKKNRRRYGNSVIFEFCRIFMYKTLALRFAITVTYNFLITNEDRFTKFKKDSEIHRYNETGLPIRYHGKNRVFPIDCQSKLCTTTMLNE